MVNDIKQKGQQVKKKLYYERDFIRFTIILVFQIL